jgi:hypothetical protein
MRLNLNRHERACSTCLRFPSCSFKKIMTKVLPHPQTHSSAQHMTLRTNGVNPHRRSVWSKTDEAFQPTVFDKWDMFLQKIERANPESSYRSRVDPIMAYGIAFALKQRQSFMQGKPHNRRIRADDFGDKRTR